jgi:LuxR family maltose regulon positive regulatory protein
MARAWLLAERFDYAKIPSVIDTVESLLGDASQDETLRAEIDFHRGEFLFLQNDVSRSLKHLQDALRTVPKGEHFVRGNIELVWALAKQMQGEEDEAVKALREGIHDEAHDRTTRTTRLLAGLTFIHVISGELNEAIRTNRELYNFAKEHDYEFARAWSVYLRGLIHFYRNELEEAISSFSEVRELRYISHRQAAIDGIGGLALAYQAAGQPERAHQAMRHLIDYVDSFKDPAWSATTDSFSARMSIMRGYSESTLSWLHRSDHPSENMLFWLEIPVLTHCRALLAEGSDASLEEAEKRLQEYLQLNQDNHNTCQMIGVSVLLAMVYQRQEKANKALSVLKKAVIMAQPGGFLRPFIELGAPMVELLKQLAKHQKIKGFVRRLLVAFRHEAASSVQDESDTQNAQNLSVITGELLEPLTNRELEVLTLLSQGLSNKEIASKMYLSSETIKKHVYNIYQKLYVHSRISAIERAKELGILPRN